ncbi:MAG: alpha/beta hydrolase [Nannocystales bacterium]
MPEQWIDEGLAEEAVHRGGAFCEQSWTIEHDVELEDGAVLHVTERFTPAAALRFPRRAVVMLPGTLVTGGMYDLDVDPQSRLNALDEVAEAGFFAYAVTYEGYPGSSIPEDGADVTTERSLVHAAEIVERIRYARGVPRVDLFGTSFGASLAVGLAGTQSPTSPSHIGRVAVQAMVYESVTPLFESVFFSPEVLALFESAPDGYVETDPAAYGLILAGADPAAAEVGFSTFPEVYATGPTLEGFELPVLPAEAGVRPLLQLWGDADPITPYEDVQALAADYGGPHELRVLPGAGHAPYIGDPDTVDAVYGEMFEFFDYGSSYYFACEPAVESDP